jgi:NAD-dependent deacetylase
MADIEKLIRQAASLISESNHLIAFTGAGISVESNIPPFRGEDGLWSKYDPSILDLNVFYSKPAESWKVIKEIFYDFFGSAKPNPAHIGLARLEEMGLLKCVITQNIDNLHQAAGSTVIHEFHGNSQKMICTSCKKHFTVPDVNLEILPPECDECNGLIKPDFIFFGESIPMDAYHASIEAAESADVLLIIGSTGEVMPANQVPIIAKQSGAKIIEINPQNSNYSSIITDIHLKGKASEMMTRLVAQI